MILRAELQNSITPAAITAVSATRIRAGSLMNSRSSTAEATTPSAGQDIPIADHGEPGTHEASVYTSICSGFSARSGNSETSSGRSPEPHQRSV